jgi:hypothetical protein
VRPQRDGVHLHFENRAGKVLSYSVESKRGGGRGGDVPVASAETVVPLPPGVLGVVCFDPYSKEDPSEKKRARLAVMDSLALWTPTSLSETCKTAVTTYADYAAGARGEHGPLPAIARRLLARRGELKPRDSLEPAGYPAQREPQVRLIRGGETLALLEFVSDGKGGWLLSRTNACTGIGLG